MDKEEALKEINYKNQKSGLKEYDPLQTKKNLPSNH